MCRERGRADENEKCQDSANNNENIDQQSRKSDSENIAQEHLTLEALENTKVAMAEFAMAALSKGANENSIKDLTMLQSALFTLQHQQVFQMQLIEQLQFQLAKANAKNDKKRVTFSQSTPNKDDNCSEQESTLEDEVFISKNSEG